MKLELINYSFFFLRWVLLQILLPLDFLCISMLYPHSCFTSVVTVARNNPFKHIILKLEVMEGTGTEASDRNSFWSSNRTRTWPTRQKRLLKMEEQREQQPMNTPRPSDCGPTTQNIPKPCTFHDGRQCTVLLKIVM